MELILSILLIVLIVMFIICIGYCTVFTIIYVKESEYFINRQLTKLLVYSEDDIVLSITPTGDKDAKGEKIYAFLNGKYITASICDGLEVKVYSYPKAFYENELDSLLAYLAMYTDATIHVNYTRI